VSPALTALGTDNVNADIEAFPDVLRVANHVHVENAIRVQSFNNSFRWNANGGDEEGSLGANYYINELVELAFGIIVATACVRKGVE
jgi:hypothetical protein